MTVLVSVFLSLYAHAFTAPGDDQYFFYEDNNTTIIFAEEHKAYLPSLVDFDHQLNAILKQTYSWEIDNHSHHVLTSSKNQVANAFATVTPHVLSAYYHSGAPLLEGFAESHWLTHTWTHEVAHLYQLNSKGASSAFVYRYLGNLPGIYSFIIHPNQLAPRHFTEGNAVLVESLFNSGGRLHSGEVRAEVYSLFKDNKVNAAWLLNNIYQFPYGAENYHVGGYFQMHLAEKFGLQRTNTYFLAQGHNLFWPFRVNGTYKDYFGQSYYSLFDEFTAKITEESQKQQQVPAQNSIATSKFRMVLNKQNDHIYTITTNLQDKPKILDYNINTKTFTQTPTKLSFNSRGKVFNIDNTFYSQASGQIETDKGVATIQGLYDSSMNLKSDSFGMHVLDIHDNKKLNFSIKSSMLEPQLHLNDEFYDTAHSKALFDQEGNVYYFKQLGENRTLYKNKKPVFTFRGFYSKLVEIKNNEVFFIANTNYGSSLFKFSNKKIFRVSEYDNIFDAKLISSSQALVTSVYSEGYRLNIVDLSSTQQSPVLYTYDVESINLDLKLESTNKKLETKKYNSFNNLKFVYFLPSFGSVETLSSTGKSKTHTVYSIDLGFSDPLGWSQLNLYYFRDTFEDDKFNFLYLYNRFRLKFGLGYNYSKFNLSNSDNKIIGSINENIFEAFVLYPYYISPRWQHSTQLSHSIQSTNNPSDQNYTTVNFNGQYSYATGNLSLHPYTYFSYQAGYRDYEGEDHLYRTGLRGLQNIGHEFYTDLSVNYAKASKNRLYFYGFNLEQSDFDELQSYSLSSTAAFSEVFRANLEIKKGFITELYTKTIPVGITRISPMVGTSFFSYTNYGYLSEQNKLQAYNHVHENYYGVEVEVLIAHELPLRFEFVEARSSLLSQKQTLFFNLGTTFNF